MTVSQLNDIRADARLSEKKHRRSSLVMFFVYFVLLVIIALALR